MKDVPVINLTADPNSVRTAIAEACTNWGFFQVTGHNVPAMNTRRVLEETQAFFSQDLEHKRRLFRSFEYPWGYYDRELTKNRRDRKEIFDYSNADPAPWPTDHPGLQAACTDYTRFVRTLALEILDLCAAGLGEQTPSLRQYFNPGDGSFTRLNYYPLNQDLARDADMPAPGKLGISHHTDAGALTVLLQDQIAGLEVMQRGEWHTVSPRADALTINVGDMLQVWTNDRYRAPLHRVRASHSHSRYSVAFFLNPAEDTVVKPLQSCTDADRPALYRAIPWQSFREQRARGDYGDFGEEVQIAHYRQEGTQSAS
ncbi:MAG: 2OG-Fe(II) oxygenase family protein [Pseudomonadota bacterium]